MVKLTQIFVLFLIFGTVKVQSQEPRKRYRKFFPMQSRRQASILSNIFFVLSAAAVERYQVYQMEHLMHLVYLPRRILFQLDHLDEPERPKPSKKRKHVGEHRASEFFFRPMWATEKSVWFTCQIKGLNVFWDYVRFRAFVGVPTCFYICSMWLMCRALLDSTLFSIVFCDCVFILLTLLFFGGKGTKAILYSTVV